LGKTTVGVTSHIILMQKIHDGLDRRMKGETNEKFAQDHTMIYALESKEHRVDTYKASEV
jgi:hypothetical protein